MRGTLTLAAQAKVNLTLEVMARRADGYHEIRSVMQRISLADRLTVEPAERLTLRCSVPALETPDNLVWRAAELLRGRYGVRRGAALRLEKRVPIAAGLGGGSSDCAAALVALNDLWELELSRRRLRELAADLGSDVPFFLMESPCALAEGRGERLTSLARFPDRWLVLAKPDVGISARAVYQALSPGAWSDGGATSAWLEAARRGDAVPAPFNALEPAALAVAPAAEAARHALLAAGAPHATMAGSGSTYFALFEAQDEAEEVADRLAAAGWKDRSWLARFATL